MPTRESGGPSRGLVRLQVQQLPDMSRLAMRATHARPLCASFGEIPDASGAHPRKGAPRSGEVCSSLTLTTRPEGRQGNPLLTWSPSDLPACLPAPGTRHPANCAASTRLPAADQGLPELSLPPKLTAYLKEVSNF